MPISTNHVVSTYNTIRSKYTMRKAANPMNHKTKK